MDYKFDNIIFTTFQEADDTLSKLREIAGEYVVVRVADLYDLVGLNGKWIDNKWGWTDRAIKSATIKNGPGDYGWIIDLPRPIPFYSYHTSSVGPKPQTTTLAKPSPVYISIHTLEVEDLDCALNSVMKQVVDHPELKFYIDIN